MNLACIIGVGRTKAGEHWDQGLVDLAVGAGGKAMDSAARRPTAIVIGNSLGGALGDQRNLAAHVASRLGLKYAETHTVEADEASGGAAMRLAVALLGANLHEAVLVIGAEKTTDVPSEGLEAERAKGLDVMREAGFGFGVSVAAALAMQRYLEKYGIERSKFFHIPAQAHAHAATNEMAFFPWPLSVAQYEKSPIIAEPFTVCDGAPACDGAAAAVVCASASTAETLARIIGSAAVSGPIGICGPVLELDLPAAGQSAAAAMAQARVALDDISLFELHDSSTIMAALSMEAIGIARPGQALALAEAGELSIRGSRPMWTFGGHKARGHALGASGMYQIVEAALQLGGLAESNQVAGAEIALAQCLGSFGSTAVTHVLAR